MAQDTSVKCILLETAEGEMLEYYMSAHPKLVQNNDKVTLTCGEETLEFGTTALKKVYPALATIKMVYKVDGEVYKTYIHHEGVSLKAEPQPEKEGYTFSGWDSEPKVMPGQEVLVSGTFNVNKYKLTYTVDGEEYKSLDVEFGSTITPETAPTKEGYTFSGWSEVPNTMPAKDVTVTGTFNVNKYKLTYTVDGEEYKSLDVEFGSAITPETAPTKEGYTFSGWSEVPSTMPAKDVTVTGTFNVNKYKLTYKIDGEEYKSLDVEFGSAITPETAPTKEGYTFSGWSEVPSTMPAKDVIVTGTFNVNKYKLTYKIDGEEYKSLDVEFGSAITPETAPTKEGYTFSGWSEVPSTMPAKDVIVTGTFNVNSYTITYMIDGEVYKTETVEYGSTITPPTVEDKTGYDFAWEEYPTTMPAKDITISGAYTTGISTIGAGKCITTKNGDFYLSGLQPNEAVKVYSVAGTLLLSAQATVQGELTISRSSLAVGVNIIKTNSQTYKIIKQ